MKLDLPGREDKTGVSGRAGSLTILLARIIRRRRSITPSAEAARSSDRHRRFHTTALSVV